MKSFKQKKNIFYTLLHSIIFSLHKLWPSLLSMLITINYNNMGNAKKTVIHNPKLRIGQYLLLFDIRYYLKISLICSKFFKNRNAKNFKIKFQQRELTKMFNRWKCYTSPILYHFLQQHLISSIVIEIVRKVLFFNERYFNYKPHKQKHLTNIQSNIYKKSHLNCPYKPLNNFLLNI